jgi:hypothetical protein
MTPLNFDVCFSPRRRTLIAGYWTLALRYFRTYRPTGAGALPGCSIILAVLLILVATGRIEYALQNRRLPNWRLVLRRLLHRCRLGDCRMGRRADLIRCLNASARKFAGLLPERPSPFWPCHADRVLVNHRSFRARDGGWSVFFSIDHDPAAMIIEPNGAQNADDNSNYKRENQWHTHLAQRGPKAPHPSTPSILISTAQNITHAGRLWPAVLR